MAAPFEAPEPTDARRTTLVTMSGTEIVEAVLRLPRDERVRVAREILRSLDEGSDEDADAAWLLRKP